jgi:hypothetical protein
LNEEKYKSIDVTRAPYKIALRAKPTSKGPNLIECTGKTSRYLTNLKTYEMPATVSMLNTTTVCCSAPSSDEGAKKLGKFSYML